MRQFVLQYYGVSCLGLIWFISPLIIYCTPDSVHFSLIQTSIQNWTKSDGNKVAVYSFINIIVLYYLKNLDSFLYRQESTFLGFFYVCTFFVKINFHAKKMYAYLKMLTLILKTCTHVILNLLYYIYEVNPPGINIIYPLKCHTLTDTGMKYLFY